MVSMGRSFISLFLHFFCCLRLIITCLFLGPISPLLSPKSFTLTAVSVRRTVQFTAARCCWFRRASEFVILSFSLLTVLLRFKTWFPPRKIKFTISAVDVVILLPCRERDFLSPLTLQLKKILSSSTCSGPVVARPHATVITKMLLT